MLTESENRVLIACIGGDEFMISCACGWEGHRPRSRREAQRMASKHRCSTSAGGDDPVIGPAHWKIRAGERWRPLIEEGGTK